MDERKREHIHSYFADRIAYFKNLAWELDRDDRADEAVFAKVQRNVYDIFDAIFAAAVKSSGQDDRKVVQFFMAKARLIPQNWQAALAQAEQHGESEKAHIERIKLDTAAEIQKEFVRIWEEST